MNHSEKVGVGDCVCLNVCAMSRGYVAKRCSVRVAESQAGVRPERPLPARSDKLMLLNNLLKIHS